MTKVYALVWQLIGLVFIIYGVGLIALQCLYWLKFGDWVSISLIDLFVPHPLRGEHQPFVLWIVPDFSSDQVVEYLTGQQPGSWVVVRKIIVATLKFLPLSITSIIASAYPFGSAADIREEARAKAASDKS